MPSDLKKLLNLENLIPLLENHQVKKAYVFGSIVTDNFDEKLAILTF